MGNGLNYESAVLAKKPDKSKLLLFKKNKPKPSKEDRMDFYKAFNKGYIQRIGGSIEYIEHKLCCVDGPFNSENTDISNSFLVNSGYRFNLSEKEANRAKVVLSDNSVDDLVNEGIIDFPTSKYIKSKR